jgi:Ca2+-binding EF-hand superfamily protein
MQSQRSADLPSSGKNVTINAIEHIQEIFKGADQNGGGDLDETEFVSALTGKLSTADGSDPVRPEGIRSVPYRRSKSKI